MRWSSASARACRSAISATRPFPSRRAWQRAAPYAEVEDWLRAIKGLGAWSATFVLLRGLGRMDQLPVGEARLGEAVAKVYGRALLDTELAAIAERYGAYRGYWA